MHALEKEMATHSSVLAWRTPRTEEPAGLLSMGVPQSQTRLKQLSTHACTGEGNGNPLQCSCLENPRDGGAWRAAVCGFTQSWTWLKQLSTHACTGEGNGNQLQCSCLENPRDRGAWWAAVYGFTQSWTRLKWLSSSSRVNTEKSLPLNILFIFGVCNSVCVYVCIHICVCVCVYNIY